MFCKQCGNQLPDGAKFCQSCGAAVVAAPQPEQPVYQQPVQQAYQQPVQQTYQQPAQQTYQQPAQQTYQQPTQQGYAQTGYQHYANTPGVADHAAVPQDYVNPNYANLGGWLLFFVIMMVLGIIGNIGSVVQTNTEWSQYSQIAAATGLGAYNTFFMVWTVFVIIECVLIAGVVALIIMRNDNFLRVYQIVCIVNLVLAIILMVYAGTLPQVANSMADLSTSFIGGIGGAILGFVLMTMYYCKSVRVRTYMGSTSYIDKALIKIGA